MNRISYDLFRFYYITDKLICSKQLSHISNWKEFYMPYNALISIQFSTNDKSMCARNFTCGPEITTTWLTTHLYDFMQMKNKAKASKLNKSYLNTLHG